MIRRHNPSWWTHSCIFRGYVLKRFRNLQNHIKLKLTSSRRNSAQLLRSSLSIDRKCSWFSALKCVWMLGQWSSILNGSFLCRKMGRKEPKQQNLRRATSPSILSLSTAALLLADLLLIAAAAIVLNASNFITIGFPLKFVFQFVCCCSVSV